MSVLTENEGGLIVAINSFSVSKAFEIETDIKLAKKGNKEVFCRIIENNKNQLYRIAKGILGAEYDIEDALQETTLKAWLQISNLKKEEYFKSWLIRILINECYGVLRRRKKVIPLEEIKHLESYDINSGEKVDLWDALSLLSDEFRAVIVLFYYEDLSYRDIAGILNISEGTVKSRLFRAKTKLEEILNVAGEENKYGR